jgi:hypothetical protein
MEGKDLTELVRLVNDRICELGNASLLPEAAFWCECGWPACKDQIQLTLREYELTGAPLLAHGHTARQGKPLPATVVMSRPVALRTGA